MIGLPEIILIFVNPKDFACFMRKLGALFMQIKDMRDTFKQSLDEFESGIRGFSIPRSDGAQGRDEDSVETGAASMAITTPRGPIPVRRTVMLAVVEGVLGEEGPCLSFDVQAVLERLESRISGSATGIMLNGSTVGVMTAATIQMITIGYRHPLGRSRAFTTRNFASGSSKHTPIQKRRVVTNGM